MTRSDSPLARLRSHGDFVIRSLYRIASDAELGFDEQARMLLKLGCERFDLEIGILAKIQGDRYEIRQVVAPEGAGMAPGDRFELDSTFCETTLRSDLPVAIEHAGESVWAQHPCYRAFHLESYVGVPVQVGGELYGTLNFSSPLPRERHFHPQDLETIQLMSTWIAGALHLDRLLHEKQELIAELESTIARMETLEGILPICAHCKNIRDDEQEWQPIEHYITCRSEAQFSHGLCPTCLPIYTD